MNVDALLLQLRQRARQRALLQALAWTLPWLAVVAVAGWRLQGAAWLLPFLAAIAMAAMAWRATRGFDASWLARALDQARPDMEDSAGLLFAPTLGTPLQVLQRERLRGRMAAGPAAELRAPWRVRALAANALLALVVAAAIPAWPQRVGPGASAVFARASVAASAARPPRLREARIEITPPAYTGLPRRSVATLAARVPEQSSLHWQLRYDPMPGAVELRFDDGQRLALSREGDSWSGSRRMARSSLYRVVARHARAAEQASLHRIDVTADRPPTLRVLQPTRTLSLVTPGQRHWSLLFEASDDHGLAGSAQLRITRTEGSGESITAREQTVSLRGQGSGTRRRYAHRIDLGALGLVPGDDLIVQLRVFDRRTPVAHSVRSASQILRWPPPAQAEASGLDGLVKKTLPAYFRSQRQVIIDAEALLARKRSLAADMYVERSDAIGVDQRLLRLRYGQFLGEETGGAASLPTNDAPEPDVPTPDASPNTSTPDAPTPTATSRPGGAAAAAAAAEAKGDGEGGSEARSATAAPAAGPEPGVSPAPTSDGGAPAAPAAPGNADTAHGDDHDDHAPSREATFGEQQAVLEQFGHTHDHAEAATLLDPETRKLLRAALDAMWQSEGALRSGRPDLALPHANRALGFIKQVQQATRIYLARVGPELPTIDEGRRLGGDRAGLASRRDPLQAATPGDPAVAAAWQALAPPGDDVTAPDLTALSRWINHHAIDDGQRLAVAAAIDAVRNDPACQRCRQRLRARLWPMLAAPPAATGTRQAAGATGDAYLDALRRQDAP